MIEHEEKHIKVCHKKRLYFKMFLEELIFWYEHIY